MKKHRTKALCLTAIGAAFLSLCGMLSFPLGPIAISLQSLGVFTVAGLLGWRHGVLSYLIYLALGALGLPIFAGFGSGFGILVGPTGGYLLAFLPAALLVGIVAQRTERALPLAIAITAADLFVLLAGSLWYHLLFTSGTPFLSSLAVGALPYLLPDAAKGALAFLLTRRLHGRI